MQRVNTQRAEEWTSFTEVSTLEDPSDTNVQWPKCKSFLMTKETRHVKRRVADDFCHDTVSTDVDGVFVAHVPQVRQHRSGDVANSGDDTTRSSAQNGVDQHPEGTHCLRQVPVRRKASEFQVHVACHDERFARSSATSKIVSDNREKFEQELMSLEKWLLTGDRRVEACVDSFEL